ncbi:MAG: RidA family protein [Bdellovibrionales bacterium]|nr:RidA family protein [Bdellovibrionales bacterium]
MKFIYTNKAPKPVGPYSQAVKAGSFIFLSGQIPLDPQTSQVKGEDIESQSLQVFKNIKSVLAEENLTFYQVVKVLVFLTDMKDFSKFNKVYESYFKDHKPARSCVEVSALPKQVKVEVEIIAYLNQ